jgi:putative phosphoesterase
MGESTMLLGVMSDTHGNTLRAKAALRMIETLGAQVIVHCGDIGSLEIPKLFTGFTAHFVAGNVDGYHDVYAQEIKGLGHHWHGYFGDLTFDDKRVAFLHGDDTGRLQQTIASGIYDLVCHGHTHVAEIRHVNEKTTVLNPGALYRTDRYSCAVVDLDPFAVHILPVD